MSRVRVRWGVKIPLRDGVRLGATLYTLECDRVGPVVFTLTPYVGQTYHDFACYFAERGLTFLTVDVRGRGNSEGVFKPCINEARDGYDVVEWLARQPYCNGKVAMWGGSYAGYDQWATAKELPPRLAAICPVAAPYMGADFSFRNNIATTYLVQWLALVSGRTSQERIFADQHLWSQEFLHWFESGAPFKEVDRILGHTSEVFQEWVAHPQPDAYWDSYNPTAEQYARLSIPILTITGTYDGDQPGALTHYRQHLRNASPDARARHYLVIGPWDHAGTRAPKSSFAGLELGPASQIDLRELHLQWYAWTMQGGSRPVFLKKNVAYYVMGEEAWHYADSLEAVTSQHKALYLCSSGNASRLFASGELREERGGGGADVYVYDPRDTSIGALEAAATSGPLVLRPTFPTDDLTDQGSVHAREGRQLYYHSAPFERDTEISGFFRLSAWISIDQPDTDFGVSIYAIDADGHSILLTFDSMRARYREDFRKQRLIATKEPLHYEFQRFTFVSRRLKKGSRLRLVIGPVSSIYSQKNYNGGGVVSEESVADARSVTVKLFHDATWPSALHVPLGHAGA